MIINLKNRNYLLQKFLLWGFFLTIYNIGYTQETIPVYNDYLSDNLFLIHPSAAGLSECGKARLTYRKQWADIQDAPSLQTFSIHTRFWKRGGIGAVAWSDKNGYHERTGMQLSYAHHLDFDNPYRNLNRLSFGIGIVALNNTLKESEYFDESFDPIITGENQTANYFNTDFSVSYNRRDFFALLTIKNILPTERNIYSLKELSNLRRHLFSSGYFIEGEKMQLEPSILFQYIEETKEKLTDINVKAYLSIDALERRNRAWGALSYRQSFDSNRIEELKNITTIVGINYKRIMFSYAYTYQLGSYNVSNNGLHQITLGFDFNCLDSFDNCRFLGAL